MSGRRCGLAVVIVLVLAARAAAEPCPTQLEGDGPPTPHLQTTSSMTLTRDDGAQRRLPPGRFVDEPTWLKLDDKFRELEDTRTRLTAENASLRESVSGWSPGWRTLAIALVTGAAGGAYATWRLTR